MGSKHPAPADQPVKGDDDLDQNAGIGQSQGRFARDGSQDFELIDGETTVEGDVENDAGLGQGSGTRLGRTND